MIYISEMEKLMECGVSWNERLYPTDFNVDLSFWYKWVDTLSSVLSRNCIWTNPYIQFVNGHICDGICFTLVYPIFWTTQVEERQYRIYTCKNSATSEINILRGNSDLQSHTTTDNILKNHHVRFIRNYRHCYYVWKGRNLMYRTQHESTSIYRLTCFVIFQYCFPLNLFEYCSVHLSNDILFWDFQYQLNTALTNIHVKSLL